MGVDYNVCDVCRKACHEDSIKECKCGECTCVSCVEKYKQYYIKEKDADYSFRQCFFCDKKHSKQLRKEEIEKFCAGLSTIDLKTVKKILKI